MPQAIARAVRAGPQQRRPTDLRALAQLDLAPERHALVAAQVHGQRSRRQPVAGSSATPKPGANIRVLYRSPAPAKQLTQRAPSSARAPASGRSAATARSSGSSTNTCLGPLSYSSTGRPEDSTPTASSSSRSRANGSHEGSGWRIRANGAPPSPRATVTGTSPRAVSSVTCSRPSAVATRIAPPSSGCPANGSSSVGVKIRARTSPRSPAIRNTVSDRSQLAREPLHRLRGELVAVHEHGELVPASGCSVNTSHDDVAPADESAQCALLLAGERVEAGEMLDRV